MGRERPAIGWFHRGGWLLGLAGREQALRCFLAALAIYHKLVEANPENIGYRFDLFNCYIQVGDLELAKKQAKEALATFETANAIVKDQSTEYPYALSVIYERIGNAQLDLGQPDQAAGLRGGRASVQRPKNWKEQLPVDRRR